MITNEYGLTVPEGNDLASPGQIRDFAESVDTRLVDAFADAQTILRPDTLICSFAAGTGGAPLAGLTVPVSWNTTTYSTRPVSFAADDVSLTGFTAGIYLCGLYLCMFPAAGTDQTVVTLKINDRRGPALLSGVTETTSASCIGNATRGEEHLCLTGVFEIHDPTHATLGAEVSVNSIGGYTLSTYSRIWALRRRGLNNVV